MVDSIGGRGEKDWYRRLVIVGNTGSGKTTLARNVAQQLDIPHIELDALHWEPNWTEAPTEIFRGRVESALRGDAWVVDGNYSKARDLIWSRAEMVVWLDYPLVLVMWQLLKRTTARIITQEELWSGNREDWRNQFGRDSLFLWAITSRAKHRDYPELARTQYPHLQFVRLRSTRETREWLTQMKT